MDGGAINIDIGIYSGIYGGIGSILVCNGESFGFRNKRFILRKNHYHTPSPLTLDSIQNPTYHTVYLPIGVASTQFDLDLPNVAFCVPQAR